MMDSEREPERDQTAVVLVHGLWMSGYELSLLGRRLQKEAPDDELPSVGYDVLVDAKSMPKLIPYRFRYSSLRQTPEENALKLATFISHLPRRRVHLVGHSLGGRIIELMLRRFSLPPESRVVTLGTPFGGSHVARRLAPRRFSHRLLAAAGSTLIEAVPAWRHQTPLGVIAGDWGLGLGGLLPGMPRPHDGIVALRETEIDGATATVKVAHSHLTMLFSRRVAELVRAFLLTGSFAPNRHQAPTTKEV